ncbi:MAG: hypothetical protein EBU36_03530, partial [Verrucomicrobia bacterium]|nr:hypothetical protein [Verrucomicrobiota bacterium]
MSWNLQLQNLGDSKLTVNAKTLDGLGRGINGLIDDLLIYNRALSSEEVGQLYQQGAGSLDTDGDGLTDAWERGYG